MPVIRTTTAKGLAMNAKIQAGTGDVLLPLTRIVADAGRSDDLLNLEAAIDPRLEFVFEEKRAVEAHAMIRAMLTNQGNPFAIPPLPPLATGFSMQMLDFFATDPDEGEILYQVFRFDPNDDGSGIPYVPSAAERAWTYTPEFTITISDAGVVTIEIVPNSLASRQSIWNSIEMSDAETPSQGVRTHLRVLESVPWTPPGSGITGYFNQGIFDPTTGLDGGGNPIPDPDMDNEGFYWVASVAGDFVPPGATDPLTFAVGDWLISDGMEFTQSAPIDDPAAIFLGAFMTEFRLRQNPADPNSPYQLAFFRNILEAVIDTQTGMNMMEILAMDEGALWLHIANTDVHVTPAWVASMNQVVAELVAFTQQDFLSPEERARWDQAALDAAAALAAALQNAGNIVDMQGQIAQLQESIFHAITANPFMITFANLNGLIITRGVWNATYHKIEC